jgi:hypothetical protein
LSCSEVSATDSFARSVFDLSLNGFLDLHDEVSARLLNTIRRGASSGELPYPTLRAYLESGPERIGQMLRLPALGRKSVIEFDELAKRAALEFGFDVRPVEPLDRTPQANAAEISAMFDISLDSFLAQQPVVSPRLMRAVLGGIDAGDCPFSTVLDYLSAGDLRLIKLCKLPNLGVTSAKEFDRLVQDAMQNGTVVPTFVLPTNATGFPDLEHLLGAVFDVLDERQTKLLLDRVALEATLEETGERLGLTRERVRQIERKAINTLLAQFGRAFRMALTTIDKQFRERGISEITMTELAELAGTDVTTCSLYFRVLERFGIDDAKALAVHDRTHLYRPTEFAPSGTWNERIDTTLVDTTWPLVYRDFIAQVSDVPRFHVAHRLSERYHAAIADDTFVRQPRLSAQKMCLQALASTRLPMHLTEIRVGVFKLFGVDLTTHHVTSIVGSHDEITVCAPGTYVRYADLPYSSERIRSIRDRVHDELQARQVFLSSTLLFERLFAADLAACPDGFNHHLLLGFAQDDTRFVTKRGNMIGLAEFDLATTYISLEDEVHNIVLEHGPIGLNDIVAHMAATRKLCNDGSVKLALTNNNEIIQVGRRTYDSLHRFFANRDEYEALFIALRVALLGGTKSVYALADEMAALGLDKASTEVIGSILTADADVSQVEGMYRLAMQDPALQRYQEIALASLAEGGVDRLHREAEVALGGEAAARYIRFDRRFQARSGQQSAVVDSELHAILSDFEF